MNKLNYYFYLIHLFLKQTFNKFHFDHVKVKLNHVTRVWNKCVNNGDIGRVCRVSRPRPIRQTWHGRVLLRRKATPPSVTCRNMSDNRFGWLLPSFVLNHSQCEMNPRDELHQELWRDHQPRADAFIPPHLLPWIPTDRHSEKRRIHQQTEMN